MNFAKFPGTPFLTEHLQWLLLNKDSRMMSLDFPLVFLLLPLTTFSTLNFLNHDRSSVLQPTLFQREKSIEKNIKKR